MVDIDRVRKDIQTSVERAQAEIERARDILGGVTPLTSQSASGEAAGQAEPGPGREGSSANF